MLLRALALVAGVAGALVPERVIDIATRPALAGYENPDDLEPREWFVDAVRYQAVLLAVAALIAPFLPTPSGDEDDAEAGPVVEVIESSDE